MQQGDVVEHVCSSVKSIPRILEYHGAGRIRLPRNAAADVLRPIIPNRSPKLPLMATMGRFISDARSPLCCMWFCCCCWGWGGWGGRDTLCGEDAVE